MFRKPATYSIFGWRSAPLAVPIGFSLFILGGTILSASLFLRQSTREQITGQHAQILYALWLSQKMEENVEAALSQSERPADLFPTVLQTAGLPQLVNLMGTRFFSEKGGFVWADPNVSEGSLTADELHLLRRLKPVARLREQADLSEVSVGIMPGVPARGPLLEVDVPLHSASKDRLYGVAQFILDGAKVAEEFRRLDRSLTIQALLTFLVGGGLLVVVLGLSYRRLQHVNLLLSERTQGLLRANQELALAAKTSAVGAVTAHLIHGLKNPLSGLQTFVASRGSTTGESESEQDWQLALSSTRRMQAMVGEIVRVLRDEETGSQYEMSLQELTGILESKLRPLAREASVELQVELEAETTLRNREANLLSLILYNLLHNAIQATPPGKLVSLRFWQAQVTVVCEVRDQGGGIPEALRAALFKPCRSTKEGGTGIGLAISKQLANCIGADLNLRESGPAGSLFTLEFPLCQVQSPATAVKTEADSAPSDR